ncbi:MULTISPECIES: SIS domain-containing protein [unclassified Stygiolobus]|jgi:fructoselysine-6-P-deglycase FrlB-like protein|uniref:SIS domain-containing protein n=1 Tax=unclassified Stygiolobus TaxID=2824672 RepID=UPI00307E378B
MNYIELIEDEVKKFHPIEVEQKITSGIIVGAGDSYAVALALEGKTSKKVIAVDPYEALHINSDRPYVIVSISGRTKTNIELAKIKRKEGRKVIAVTANPTSPLAENSTETILIPYNSNITLPGTLSFLLALSAVYSLFGIEIPKDYIKAKSFELREKPFFVGQGENYGIAYFSALKLNEIFCENANYERFELFLHSPIFSTRGRQIVLLNSGSERERRLKKLIDFTYVYLTECTDAFCNALTAILAIIERMKRENWNRICFIDDKKILNISSEMIY